MISLYKLGLNRFQVDDAIRIFGRGVWGQLQGDPYFTLMQLPRVGFTTADQVRCARCAVRAAPRALAPLECMLHGR